MDFSTIKSITIPEGDVKKIQIGSQVIWEKPQTQLNAVKFTLRSIDGASRDNITIRAWNLHDNAQLKYSIDNGSNWIAVPSTETVIINNAPVGTSILLKNTSNSLGKGYSTATGRVHIRIACESYDDSWNVEGPIKYLLNDGEGWLTYYCFNNLFSDTHLYDASGLDLSDFTSVTQGAYMRMFADSGLVIPPELPATMCYQEAYYMMFFNCENLSRVPTIPAMTSVAGSAFKSMFSGCTNLTNNVNNPIVIDVATIGQMGCQDMFGGTAIKSIEIKASNLVGESCREMFKYCTQLRSIKLTNYTGPISTDTNNNFTEWVEWYEGQSSGTFYYNGSDTGRGISGIPTGWTIQTF